MKKTVLAASLLATISTCALAQTAAAPAAPASPHTLTGNISLVSDYRFRGISQTYRQPAIQGGFDYSHSSGLYLGNWNSSVSGNSYNNGAGIEMDFYGGYKWEPVKDLTADVGLLYYYYPGAEVGVPSTRKAYNNGEIYVGASYKWFSAKYSYGVTDFFGLATVSAGSYAATALPGRGDSKGSGYLDLNANFDIAEKTTLSLHVGRQTVKNYSELSYTDYKIGVSRDMGFATVGLALIGTNANATYYRVGPSLKETGKTTAVLSASKTF